MIGKFALRIKSSLNLLLNKGNIKELKLYLDYLLKNYKKLKFYHKIIVTLFYFNFN